MPVSVPVGTGVATVRIEYAVDSDVAFNVLHYQLKSATVVSTGLPVATDPLAQDCLPKLAESACIPFAEAWKPVSSNEVSITGATSQKVFPSDRSTPFHYTPATPFVGEVSSNTLPMQDCITLLKQTGYGQRWGIGRVFIPGIPESLADKGFVGATYLSDGSGMPANLKADVVYTVSGITYRWKPVVTNVPTTGVPRVLDVVEAIISNDTIKTQRRRRPGKGI